jgi:heme/copper-type cytochrome/quinol oxidase subunit 2
VTLRRLELLQWFGLVAAGPTWFGQLVLGWGLTEARCGAGGQHWEISNDTWQALLMTWGVAVFLAAEAAAVIVFRRTAGAEEDDPPPPGRMHFFATAAMTANVIFLIIILLTGFASILNVTCRQS